MFKRKDSNHESLKVLVASVCLMLLSGAQAAIVDNGMTTLDTTTGLEWLDLTETVDYSFNGVDSELDAGGLFSEYRKARQNEVLELFYNMNLYPNTDEFDDPALTRSPPNDDHRRFIELFGTTIHNPGYGQQSFGYAADEQDFGVIMGLNAINWKTDRRAYVLERGYSGWTHSQNHNFEGFGTYLVRQDRAVPVPEIDARAAPATLGLLIGVMLVVAERRKRWRW